MTYREHDISSTREYEGHGKSPLANVDIPANLDLGRISLCNVSTLHLQLSSRLVSYTVDSNTQDEPRLRRLYSNFLKYRPIARVLLKELNVMKLSGRLDRLEKRAEVQF